MPKYHFDIADGVRLADPVGLDCADETDAKNICWMTVRDRWTERLICRNCGNAGSAQFSAPDRFSWDAQIDSVSEGFKAIKLEYGSDLYCSACNCRVEP